MALARKSIAFTVCDEVVAVLENAGFQAVTDPCPHVDMTKVKGRQIFVTPGPVDVHPITRGSDEERIDVAICVIEKPKTPGIDAQLELMHEIARLFSRAQLPSGTVTAVTPQHNLESWWSLRVFSGQVTLSVWLGVHGR